MKKKLGEVCEINYGTRVRRKDSRSDNYPVYGGGGETFRWETFNRENQCVVSRFAMSPECVRFVSGKFFLNDSGLTVDTASDGLLQDYLDWCLFGKQDIIYALGKGSAQKNLDIREFGNIPIPIPPLPEQKRIVAKIDAAFEKIDKLKANAERNLANAKDLFQSALDEAMRPKPGWVEKRLGEVCDSVLGKMLDRMKNRGRPEKYLRNVNVRWGSFDLSNLLEMGFEEDEQERFGLRRGDLVMCEGGEPGRCAVWTGVPAKMKFQKALHRIRCPKELNPYFLYYQFRAQAGAGVLQKYFDGRDATIKHLTGKLLKTVLLFFPSLAEQKEIIKRLDFLAEKTKLLEHHYTRQIADCAEMRQSVLREAFEGRL